MNLIDGHLDLAMCAVMGRDLTMPLEQLRENDPIPNQTATVSFPELRAANLNIAFATLFSWPASAASDTGYTNAEQARAQALSQLEQYHRWEDQGLIRVLTSRRDVKEHLAKPDGPLGIVLLMEGADPVRDADDLPFWVEAGVRVIGPAWQRTRYAGGTDTPGPLTPEGKELVAAMKEMGVTLDASHLDEAAFWDAAEIGPKMIATHSNSRQFVSGNRHLTDDMARAIAQTDGVIGLVLLNNFIQEGWQKGQAKTELNALLRHAQHYADLIGWERIALGTDMDGGFGAEKTPAGIERYADIPKSLDFLPEEHREQVAFGNWARWLTQHL